MLFVCLKLCQQLFCANLLLRAFEGGRVLNGLACKYTKSHLDYMLHALGENLYILTSTTSTNTEIPTWTTYSEWEFVCFNKYRNTLICKCQIMKYLDIQMLLDIQIQKNVPHLNDEVPEFLEVAIALPGVAVDM